MMPLLISLKGTFSPNRSNMSAAVHITYITSTVWGAWVHARPIRGVGVHSGPIRGTVALRAHQGGFSVTVVTKGQ